MNGVKNMKQNSKIASALILVLLLSLLPVISIEASQSSQAIANKQSNTNLAGLSTRNQEGDLEGLQQYVEMVMKELPVAPGLAIAVVRGDKIIYAKGFGYRDLKSKLPVNPQTQFYIASTTKSFTATAAKLLAEEGKLDLDAPLKTYFPNLVLKAPLSADQISLRDLLTHRSGMSNEAIVFRTAYTGQYDANEIINLLSANTAPISPQFKYSNLGYVIAGYVMEKVVGEPWQKIVKMKILDPLGMGATTAYASQAKAGANYALPYMAEDGAFIELPYKEDNTMHPGGGLVSSAEDLAKWLTVNMNGGRFNGKQVISPAALEEILSPQINQHRDFYKFKRYAYSLGWNIGTYEEDKLIHCFGEFDGFRPHVSFMPEHKIGVIVLANESRDGLFLPDLIACDIYDHLLRKKPFQVSTNARVKEYAAMLQKNREERKKRAASRESEREKGTTPTLDPAAYAGTYQNQEFGRINISVEGASLVARFGNLSSKLEHYQRDIFEAMFIPGEKQRLSFKANKDGVTELSLIGKPFVRVQAN
jgi:CubicO group peptidase (beta-lactamase class C family)